MKRFKNFLAEGMSTEVSTALETVLGASYASVSQNDPKILKDAMASDKNFKTAKKYWDTGNTTQSLKNLQVLGKKIMKSKAPPGAGGFDFQSGGNLSKFWTDNGGVNNTAKADIILGGKQYSVKNANGAQLMSGKKGESSATAAAAADALGMPKIASGLIKSIQNLETVTTKGYYASADNLKRLKQNADKNTTLFMLATALDKESKRYDKEFAQYKKDKVESKRYDTELKQYDKDKVKLKKKKDKKGLEKLDKKWLKAWPKKSPSPKNIDKLDKEWLKAWPPGASGNKKITSKFTSAKTGWSKIGTLSKSGKPSLGRDLPKVLKGGKQSKELETKLSKENKAFTNFVNGKFQDNQDEVKSKLEKLFKKNPDFQREFCYEAASGKRKFKDGAVQTADHMLSWAPDDAGVQEFKVSTYAMKDSSADIVSKYSSQMTLDVNWKSSSTYKHKGYNVYQNVRLGLGKLIEEVDYVQDTLFEEFDQLKNSLQEGTVNEGEFFNKLKSMATDFVSTIKELGQRIFNWFKEAINKIKSAAEEGMVALGSILGFEMEVATNADQEISIPI